MFDTSPPPPTSPISPSFISILYSATIYAFLLFFFKFRDLIPDRRRLYLACVVGLVYFFIITSLVKVDTIPPTNFFVFLMISVVVIAFFSAFGQSGIFQILSRIPPVFTAHQMNGQGVAAVVVSLTNIATIWAYPPGDSGSDEETTLAAFIYFIVATGVMVMALVLTIVLFRMRLYQYYVYLHEEGKQLQEKDKTIAEAVGDAPTVAPPYSETFRQIWPLVLATMATYMVTLSLFPAIVSNISPVEVESSSRIFHDLFVPFNFLVFSVGDFLGRWIVARWTIISPRWLLPASLVRVVFYPLIILSNVIFYDSSGNPIEPRIPSVLASDPLTWVVIFLLAFTNGQFATLGMMYSTSEVTEAHKVRASTLSVLGLYTGLLVGSLLSFLIRGVMCQCNPFVS